MKHLTTDESIISNIKDEAVVFKAEPYVLGPSLYHQRAVGAIYIGENDQDIRVRLLALDVSAVVI
jgi:hypothetical protein